MAKNKKLSGSFRYTQWDPCLIISQIVAMQSVLYLTLSLIMAIMQDLTGSTRTLNHIFEYHELQVRDYEGRSVIAAYVLNAIVGALALWNIVGRTKLCLDFSCTYHGVHLLACWLYNGAFPTTFSWWTLNIACAAITCVTGEFLCLRTELQAIPLANIGGQLLPPRLDGLHITVYSAGAKSGYLILYDTRRSGKRMTGIKSKPTNI